MKPLLLLDVDGALSPLPSRYRYPDGIEWVQVTHVFSPVLVDARLPGWLRGLAELYDLVWATTWEEMANELLTDPLGLPPLPLVRFSAVSERRAAEATWRHGCRKLAGVRTYIGKRPAAWIDDSFTLATLRWARRRRYPTLFLPTNPHIGITERHVARLESWARVLSVRSIGDAINDGQLRAEIDRAVVRDPDLDVG